MSALPGVENNVCKSSLSQRLKGRRTDPFCWCIAVIIMSDVEGKNHPKTIGTFYVNKWTSKEQQYRRKCYKIESLTLAGAALLLWREKKFWPLFTGGISSLKIAASLAGILTLPPVIPLGIPRIPKLRYHANGEARTRCHEGVTGGSIGCMYPPWH